MSLFLFVYFMNVTHTNFHVFEANLNFHCQILGWHRSYTCHDRNSKIFLQRIELAVILYHLRWPVQVSCCFLESISLVRLKRKTIGKTQHLLYQLPKLASENTTSVIRFVNTTSKYSLLILALNGQSPPLFITSNYMF